MKRRLLSILLMVSMLLTMFPATAGAAGTEPVAPDHTDHADWTALSEESTSLASGKYYLENDVTMGGTSDITIAEDSDVTFCLNGNVLNLNGKHIEVPTGSSLTICDCQTTLTYGNINADGLWEESDTTGDCDLTGGVITGGMAEFGGAIHAEGDLTLKSGNIAGNCAAYNGETPSGGQGGGVYAQVASATANSFTMDGGSITGNKAVSMNAATGGGIYVYSSKFIMNGGSISHNWAYNNREEWADSGYVNSSGGGVCLEMNYAGAYMNGGSITGNKATAKSGKNPGYGGGVYVSRCNFTMNEGTIADNEAGDANQHISYGYGGGVYDKFFHHEWRLYRRKQCL